MMNEVATAYFESVNPIAKKIVRDTRLVQVLFGDKWEQLNEQERNGILDDYFVHPDAREKYQRYEKQDTYPISYPVLKVQMGEKIVVDEANDFWTWQDEFSGPFSWKTKSQQDLTLLDLEPEQMMKQAKTRRRLSKDLSDEASKKAPREFPVQESSLWNSEFKLLKNVRLPQPKNDTVVQHQGIPLKRENSPEEVNHAFKRDSFIDTYSSNQNGGNSEVLIINDKFKKEKPDIELSVFENPMISHVIDDEDSTSSSTTSPSRHPFLPSNMSPSRKPLIKADSIESSYSDKSTEKQINYSERVGNDDKTHLVSDVDFEDTELIAVRTEGSELKASRMSVGSIDLPRTGFDFLDQW